MHLVFVYHATKTFGNTRTGGYGIESFMYDVAYSLEVVGKY